LQKRRIPKTLGEIKIEIYEECAASMRRIEKYGSSGIMVENYFKKYVKNYNIVMEICTYSIYN
jgi:hypothetical protein